ncbi:MAG TPA: FAD/NAD(P)-binding oxidoreductase [Galbitalea sp.]|nr:FAD/NAD(P)-binding oxidoreductase [Galbitalea sp.]
MSGQYKYLVVGGGMVADAAARGIREVDPDGSIGILSEDVDEPYARPALTKKLWTDPNFEWDQADLHTARDTGADIRTETAVARIYPERRMVTTEDGAEFGYGILLIATGGHPKHIDLPDDERVIYFRSAADYRRLRELAAAGAHVAVIGGSYIGMELAAALVQNGSAVTLIFPEATLGEGMFPENLARVFEAKYIEHGVKLLSGVTAKSGTADAGGITLALNDGSTLEVDAVVSGLGIEPAVHLAADAGLEVRDGISVDTYLAASMVGVYAAGDVAMYPDRLLGPRRVEHVDNAKEMGRVVGHNMAGDVMPYVHTPYYYSTVFDVSYEAVGQLDAGLETVNDWSEPLERGVVYYVSDGRVVGVLLWNIAGRTDEARGVIGGTNPTGRESLIGRIPLSEG